jgi:hypothetical protein
MSRITWQCDSSVRDMLGLSEPMGTKYIGQMQIVSPAGSGITLFIHGECCSGQDSHHSQGEPTAALLIGFSVLIGCSTSEPGAGSHQ